MPDFSKPLIRLCVLSPTRVRGVRCKYPEVNVISYFLFIKPSHILQITFQETLSYIISIVASSLQTFRELTSSWSWTKIDHIFGFFCFVLCCIGHLFRLPFSPAFLCNPFILLRITSLETVSHLEFSYTDTWERIVGTSLGDIDYTFILTPDDSKSLARRSSVNRSSDVIRIACHYWRICWLHGPLAWMLGQHKDTTACGWFRLLVGSVLPVSKWSEQAGTRVLILLVYLTITSQRKTKQFSQRHTKS